MNVHRFLSLPNALKPVILLFALLSILLAASSPATETAKGIWFFWLTSILQLVFMTAVCGLFLYEAETFLGCSREGSWPVVEMAYSSVGFCCNLLNTFILAAAHKKEIEKKSNSYLVAAFTAMFLALFYAIGGFMMLRIWRGFVKSGASQNPAPNMQPGNVGSMHPGI